jgi:hypothetical protein
LGSVSWLALKPLTVGRPSHEFAREIDEVQVVLRRKRWFTDLVLFKVMLSTKADAPPV